MTSETVKLKDVYTETVLKVLCNRVIYVGINLPPILLAAKIDTGTDVGVEKEQLQPPSDSAGGESKSVTPTLVSTSSTMIQFSDLPSIRKLISIERMR